MRYRVRHVTEYDYADPVDLGSHMLHLHPRTLPHQLVRRAQLSVTPTPSRQTDGTDHFGNRVSWIFLDTPHDRFAVTLDAVVEVAFQPPPEPGDTAAWERVAAAARSGGAAGWVAAEFAFDSPLAAADPAAGAYAAESFSPGRPILAGVRDLMSRIRRDFAFRAGVTTILTPVARLMAQRAGVCQDFSHVMISGLRALGLPARYVSGYLRTRPPPGATARRGADQSHAWVGVWLGPEHGWVDFDPTNDLVVADEHVVLSWGRDFSDVSPIRGVLLGGGRHRVSVTVDLAPVDELTGILPHVPSFPA